MAGRRAWSSCSFGDASVNHATATGALNAAAYAHHRAPRCPVLFVCEDNGLGISTPSPRGWVGRGAAAACPGIAYFAADGCDPATLLDDDRGGAGRAYAPQRRPAVLHLQHGPAHGPRRLRRRDRLPVARRDRGRPGARPAARHRPALVEARSLDARTSVLARYEEVRRRGPRELAEEVAPRAAARDAAAEVDGAAGPPTPDAAAARPPRPRGGVRGQLPETRAADPRAGDQRHPHRRAGRPRPTSLVFGEDVGRKGGVYGVTRGLRRALRRRPGSSTPCSTSRPILGPALGAGLAGLLPVPEIQYLAYLHNAEDQLRGEAAIAAVLLRRAVPQPDGRAGRRARLPEGLRRPLPQRQLGRRAARHPRPRGRGASHPRRRRPACCARCLDAGRGDGRVCVFLEPIALYHTRDLYDGDGGWLAPYDARPGPRSARWSATATGRDLLIVTFGNGVHISLRVAATPARGRVRRHGPRPAWLAPLPLAALPTRPSRAAAVLVVDETRHSGGVAEAVVAALVDAGVDAPARAGHQRGLLRPPGTGRRHRAPPEDEIVAAARQLLRR